MAGGAAGGCACGLSHIAQRAGTNERDSTYAASIANATAKAMGRNRNLPNPGMNAKGAKTSSVQQLATSSGMATSLAPRNAASFADAPKDRCRCVFSRQM